MKIALISDSLLLGKTLEMYLKDYLTSCKACDFVVATQPIDSQKPVFLIGEYENANLNKPFTKEVLLEKLRIFYESFERLPKMPQQKNLLYGELNLVQLIINLYYQKLVKKFLFQMVWLIF